MLLNDAPQQSSQNIRAGDDLLLLAPENNNVLIDNVIV